MNLFRWFRKSRPCSPSGADLSPETQRVLEALAAGQRAVIVPPDPMQWAAIRAGWQFPPNHPHDDRRTDS